MDELQSWLDDNWDPGLTVGDWWERLGMSGWAAPLLPAESYGRGLSRGEALAVQQTIAKDGASRRADGSRADAGRRRLSCRMAPGSRSTTTSPSRHRPGGVVSALQRTGRRVRPRRAHHKGSSDGDEWHVRGRRGGRRAARSPTSACCFDGRTPRCPSTRASRGRIDMHQPGVEVRPLREMTGARDVQRGVPHSMQSSARRGIGTPTTVGPSPTPRFCGGSSGMGGEEVRLCAAR